MADILNLPNCGGSTSTFNSGAPLCDVIRKQPKALFLFDSGVVINAAARQSIAATVAFLKTSTRSARGARCFPIKDITNYEDVSKEPTRGTVGNLSIIDIVITDAIPAFKFQHRKGDLYHQQLAAAQNANLTLMILDSGYVLYGTKTSNGDMTGYSLSEFYAELAKFATASEPSKYPFSVTLSSLTEYKENFAIIQLDATVLNVSGNVDVQLTAVSQAANVVNISVIGRGGKNLGDLYPTELAAVAAWDLVNTQTGAPVTITSVTYNSTTKNYILTADSTAYTALTTGQKFTANLKAPAPLSALGVDGYESLGGIFITKP
jgi:hypothetical protein